MQKKLIALAIAGMAVAPAFAQNVQIYGRLDIAVRTDSTDKTGMRIDDLSSNRWGFKGSEELGGGLSAFFQLGNRFYLQNGNDQHTANDDGQWTDKAWVGLNYKPVGALSFGRVLTVGNTVMGGGDFEALTDTHATVNSRNGNKQNQVNNGMKFESAKFGPMSFMFHYGAKESTTGGASPYGVAARFAQGPVKVDTFYQKDTVSGNVGPIDTTGQAPAAFTNGNFIKTIGIGGQWNLGAVILKSTYARSKGFQAFGYQVDNQDFQLRAWSHSINVPVKSGQFGFAYNKVLERGNSSNGTHSEAFQPQTTKLIAGYIHDLSKRTKLFATQYYERKADGLGSYTTGDETGGSKHKSHSWQTSIGMRHEF